MTSLQDHVTVVIPTRHRPDLVTRAVESALAQTYGALEVVVIIDGPDPETAGRLNALADPRLTVLELERNVGAAEARNIGIRRARGAWIAFLDDDDHWMPEKIAVQMAARPAGVRYPIISCRCQVPTARGTYVWPRRPATVDDVIDEYLFVRRGLFKGETFATTSSLLVPRELLLMLPFPKSMFDDWEWMISCARVEGCRLITVPEVLAVHYTETERVTLSTCRNIDAAIGWAISMQPKMTPRAYAGLLMQSMGGEAAARTAAVRWRILSAVWRDGRPTPMALATYLLHSLMPVGLRRRVRKALFSASTA